MKVDLHKDMEWDLHHVLALLEVCATHVFDIAGYSPMVLQNIFDCESAAERIAIWYEMDSVVHHRNPNHWDLRQFVGWPIPPGGPICAGVSGNECPF